MGLRSYIARRLIEIVPTLFAIILFNFVLIHSAPGGPGVAMSGEIAPPEYVEALRVRYGLDKPLPDQFAIYLMSVLSGDLGYSIPFHRPVMVMIAERIPATLALIITAIVFSLIVGVFLGVYAARKHLSRADIIISFVSVLIYSLPIFLVGLFLLIVFGVYLHWLPTSGMITVTLNAVGLDYALDYAKHLFLPAVTLSAWYLPQYIRLTRASVIEVMREDYITTARATGLSESRIFMRHALRNAILPVVTMTGMWLGFALGGALLTETVFGWPGIGRLVYDSIFYRDYPILMGSFLIVSIAVVLATLITDISYAFLDPRIVYK